MFDWGPPDSLLRQALARARSLAELNFFTRNAEKECSEGEAKVGERAPSLPPTSNHDGMAAAARRRRQRWQDGANGRKH